MMSPTYASHMFEDVRIKAAFLYQLPNFIELPEKKIRVGKQLIHVCVVGDNPFNMIMDVLEKEIQGKNHFTFLQKEPSSSLIGCHIVFIGKSEKAIFQQILDDIKDQPILTVSAIGKFAKYGGMVGFTEFDGNIRLEINTSALAHAKFKVDQHLLEVALHVY